MGYIVMILQFPAALRLPEIRKSVDTSHIANKLVNIRVCHCITML